MEWFVAELQKNPKDSRSHRNLAALLLADGRIEKALQHYEVAIQNEPRNPGLSNDMGVALLKAGNKSRAKLFFEQAIDLAGDKGCSQAHMNIASLYANQGDWNRALDHCNETLRLTPRNAAAHRNKAKVLDRLCMTAEAVMHNEMACQLERGSRSAENVATYSQIGVQLTALGRSKNALNYTHASRRLRGAHVELHI